MRILLEFDKSLLLRSLKINGFNVEELNIEKISHVPMHDYRITTKEKYMLYIEGLQCCIGLYIYGNNFAFAAHINTVVFENNEYKLDIENEPIYLNRIDDLLETIILYCENNEIKEPFKIGISYGVSPLNKYENSIRLIYEGLNKIIKELTYRNIPIILQSDIYEPEFIVDAKNNALILSNKK